MNNVLILTSLMGVTLIGSSVSLQRPRFLGGNQAKPGQFPFIVSIHGLNHKGKLSHFCGGSILDKSHVITAAHCVWNLDPGKLEIIAGAHNIKESEASQQRVEVQTIRQHPKYSSRGKGGSYDVAIIKLSKNLTLNEHVKSVKLASSNDKLSNNCANAGWGNLYPVSSVYYKNSDVLLTSQVEIVDPSLCSLLYPNPFFDLSTVVCGSSQLFAGSCQGDSGGPLICYATDSTPYLVGLASWGFIVCGDSLHPDIYTDIANTQVFDFVEKHVENIGTASGAEQKSDPPNIF